LKFVIRQRNAQLK